MIGHFLSSFFTHFLSSFFILVGLIGQDYIGLEALILVGSLVTFVILRGAKFSAFELVAW